VLLKMRNETRYFASLYHGGAHLIYVARVQVDCSHTRKMDAVLVARARTVGCAI
jgi:hypothetical protein